MDKQVKNCPGLTEADIVLLKRIEQGLPITADISRADIFVCCRLAEQRALIISHARPCSISPLYEESTEGRLLTKEEQPLILQTLTSGSGGRQQREVVRNGAPVIQDVHPIRNEEDLIIGAFVVETNMLAYERQRRRNRHFRRAVPGLQEMCSRGELQNADLLSRFGLYDGIYLIDQERRIRYMSGNANNLYRTAGILADPEGAHISMLEVADTELVEEAFRSRHCLEVRHEATDGRIWARKAVPFFMPPAEWLQPWATMTGLTWPRGRQRKQTDINAMLVLVHNATESVQKQRELNVKSAIIQEVHHRVKNNLQNIAAILRIQARRCTSEEAKQHLSDAVNRVLSMSVIHEFLSQDEHRPISLRDICQRIAAQVVQVSSTPEQEINIQVAGPNIRLPASQATPAAMVVNELLLNAVEHGLRDRRRGSIQITLRDHGQAVELLVEDDGNGLPADFSTRPTTSLGLQIVHTLVTDDLKGKLQMESIAPTMTAVTTEPPSVVNGGAENHPAIGDDGRRDEETRVDAEAEQAITKAKLGTRVTVIFPKRSLGVD
ncbi:MAG: histidine kinase N-terminal domain-containing protein [Caldilineaceae bacterium]|nr:histidine kinase N-terminal domain-containing protein [Caldilineaceae bacterium]